jgi:very-short-patch-repair endonuclease
VTVPSDRRRPGINIHRCPGLTRRDRRKHQGIRVTSPARTLLDCAPKLNDKRLARAVNEARLSKHLRLPALADVIERFPLHPGAKRLARFVELDTPPTRSEFEDAFLTFCERFDLPRPKINARVCGYEVDALFEQQKLIVELDGYRFHSSRASFERDRDRDANTLRGGYGTVRITWDRMINSAEREANRLRAILEARS